MPGRWMKRRTSSWRWAPGSRIRSPELSPGWKACATWASVSPSVEVGGGREEPQGPSCPTVYGLWLWEGVGEGGQADSDCVVTGLQGCPGTVLPSVDEVSSRVLAVPAAQSSSCSGPLGLQGLTGFLCASASKLTSSEDLAPKAPPPPLARGL